MARGKTKIAVLGGGIGALAAVFELTEQDKSNELYDITVYTLGWRLGGKCAVGRNEDKNWRAEEHGIHVWAGFYDNAFDLVRRCYAGLKRPKYAWRSHFEGLNHFTIMERRGQGWEPWLLQFSPNNLTPGSGDQRVSPLGFVKAIAPWIWQHYATSELRQHLGPEHLTAAQQRLAHAETLPQDARQISSLQKTTAVDHIRLCLEDLHRVDSDAISNDLRHDAILIQLGLAIIHGILNDDVFIYGFDHIDSFEWSEWLKRNGCTDHLGLSSALVRGCYDYVFGYKDQTPRVGAGTGTRALLRFLLNYKGSILYTLQTTMGEFLFAPLYELLCKRGVEFKFFHRVDKLNLTTDGKAVSSIELSQQVELTNGKKAYLPLVRLPSGQLSWPSHPLYSQISKGDSLAHAKIDLESPWADWPVTPLTLEWKKHFDLAILGIGFGALKPICFELAKGHSDRWGNLLKKIETTQTIGVQLWLRPSTRELGWPESRAVLTAFAEPLNTWEDNSQLISMETWPDEHAPGSLHYFVGIFHDTAGTAAIVSSRQFLKSQSHAKESARRWIDAYLPMLWPAAKDQTTGGFRWDFLVAPSNESGAARLNSQYVRANINPSDHYVLSVPGSVQYRLAADDSGVENLFLAGDWVRTGLNAGCVEAAVMAGRAAAQAITGIDMSITGRNDFDSGVLPISLLPIMDLLRRLKRTTAAGIGRIDAHCAIVLKPASYVTKKLPTGLTLVRPPELTDKHPVILIFSKQRNVRPGFVPFGGISYHEFVELIPSVAFAEGGPAGGPFSYMPYLLLDQIAPVVVGVNLYGFNKRLGRIRSRGGSYEIRSELGETRARFDDEWLPGDISKFENMNKVRDLMELPLIGQTPTGSWVFSYLDFGLDAATIQATKGTVEIGEPVIQPGPDSDGDYSFYRFPSIRDEPYGAFRLSTKWTLSVPLWFDDTLGTAVPKDLREFATSWSNRTIGRFRGQF